ncbi:hypothetical protein JCM6882_003449, partial [Rhodosporidiobolus microsporus]
SPSSDSSQILEDFGSFDSDSGAAVWAPVTEPEGAEITVWITDSQGNSASTPSLKVTAGNSDSCLDASALSVLAAATSTSSSETSESSTSTESEQSTASSEESSSATSTSSTDSSTSTDTSFSVSSTSLRTTSSRTSASATATASGSVASPSAQNNDDNAAGSLAVRGFLVSTTLIAAAVVLF